MKNLLNESIYSAGDGKLDKYLEIKDTLNQAGLP